MLFIGWFWRFVWWLERGVPVGPRRVKRHDRKENSPAR